MSPLKNSVIELQSTDRKLLSDKYLPSYRDYITSSLYHFLTQFAVFNVIFQYRYFAFINKKVGAQHSNNCLKMFGVLLYALHDHERDFQHAWFYDVFHQPPIEFFSYNLV